MSTKQKIVGLLFFVLAIACIQFVTEPLLLGQRFTGWLRFANNLYVMLWFWLGVAYGLWRSKWEKL